MTAYFWWSYCLWNCHTFLFEFRPRQHSFYIFILIETSFKLCWNRVYLHIFCTHNATAFNFIGYENAFAVTKGFVLNQLDERYKIIKWNYLFFCRHHNCIQHQLSRNSPNEINRMYCCRTADTYICATTQCKNDTPFDISLCLFRRQSYTLPLKIPAHEPMQTWFICVHFVYFYLRAYRKYARDVYISTSFSCVPLCCSTPRFRSQCVCNNHTFGARILRLRTETIYEMLYFVVNLRLGIHWVLLLKARCAIFPLSIFCVLVYKTRCAKVSSPQVNANK